MTETVVATTRRNTYAENVGEFAFRLGRDGNVAVLSVSGVMDARAAEHVVDAVDMLAVNGIRRVRLLLGGLTRLECSAAGVLRPVRARLAESGIDFEIAGAGFRLRRTLARIGCEDLLDASNDSA